MKLRGRFFVIVLIVVLISIPAAAGNTQLKMVRYFPKEGSGLDFKSVPDIEITEDEVFLLENFPGHRVARFSKDGTFKNFLGKAGLKPGELVAAISLSIQDDRVAVKDDQGITFFKKDGTLIRRIRPFANIIDFQYIRDKIYCAGAMPDSATLVQVFDTQGKLLREFGEKPAAPDHSILKGMRVFGSEHLANDGRLLTDGRFLYFLNSTFGLVKKYSLEGLLSAEYDISGVFGEEGKEAIAGNTKLWLEEGIDLKETEGRIPTRSLFEDAYLNKDDVYLLTRKIIQLEKEYKSESKLMVLDKKTFILKDIYPIQTDGHMTVAAVSVEKQDGEPVFYFSAWVKDKSSVVAEFRRSE